MTKKEQPQVINQFAADVYSGLTSKPKYINSKYFYDEKGDFLFQEIMALPEYYLTRLELDIIQKNKEGIAAIFDKNTAFDLIELGAGDGKKTKILLNHFQQEKTDFKYIPIDISSNALQNLKKSLKAEMPTLEVEPRRGTYFEVLEQLKDLSSRKKLILFLGSNIGNLPLEEAILFLQKLENTLNKEDLLLIGFDQKKNPQQILDAYNDASGVTEAFNKNLLRRINRELEANFKPETFLHWPVYDPETGLVKSFLLSKIAQEVQIKSLNLGVHFEAWESLHTENSQKYDEALIKDLANHSNLKASQYFSDENELYKMYLFKKNNI